MSTIEAGKNPRDIILKPVTTEKSLALMDLGKYTFEVDPRANKTEIKIALERIFGVKIGSIATQNRKGKTYRTRLKPVDGGKKLEMRGYIGPFYRTQTWIRVE